MCRALTPSVRRIAGLHRDRVDLVEIDVATDPGRAAGYSVRAVPTVIGIRGDTPIGRKVGAATPDQLESLFIATARGAATSIPVAPVDRFLRLGAGLAVVALAVAASQPLLVVPAIGLAVAAFPDVIRRWKRSGGPA